MVRKWKLLAILAILIVSTSVLSFSTTGSMETLKGTTEERGLSAEYTNSIEKVEGIFKEKNDATKPSDKVVDVLKEYLENGSVPKTILQFNSRDDHTSISRGRIESEKTKVGVIVLADESLPPSQSRDKLEVRHVFPLEIGYLYLADVGSPKELLDLTKHPGVIRVTGDVIFEIPREMENDEYLHSLAIDKELVQFQDERVRYILDADRVHEEFGVNGSGIIVAIVDTGVDFGNPDLRQARTEDGIPISIDIDGYGVEIASLDIGNVGNVLPTAGETVVEHWRGGHYQFTFPYDITLSDSQISQSKSGVFRVGVFDYDDSGLLPFYYYVPMVLVDTTSPGVYDTLYLDLSSFYGQVLLDYGLNPFYLNITWGENPLIDYSIADEEPHRWGDGSEVLARDFNGDGIPDISMGSLSWVADLSRPGGEGYIPGLGAVDTDNSEALGLGPANWSLVGVQWAREGYHGTCVAGSAAGTGVHEFYLTGFESDKTRIPGVAPGATLMAVNAWSTGQMIMGWFWAAGLEVNSTGTGYNYVPWHHADIISNSWGVSNFLSEGVAPSWSPYTAIADLLSIPGYLNESYPGTMLVMAAGSGGHGYGTVTDPAAATLPISVGASTENEWLHYIYGAPLPQIGDEVVPWSARGPTFIGQVKPDVVSLGAYSVSITSINWLWSNYGDGSYSITIFGGSSQAAATTAGALAVVMEAMKINDIEVNPQLAKNILMSTAMDLGYDPFTQGAGRVDVYEAVSLVNAMAHRMIEGQPLPSIAYSPSTYDVTEILGGNMPLQSINISSVYGGRLYPRSSVTVPLVVESYMIDAAITVSPKHLTLKSEVSTLIQTRESTYALNLTSLLISRGMQLESFNDADLVRIFVSLDEGAHYYGWETMPYVYLVDWYDEDGDGVYDHEAELHLVSSAFSDGTILQVAVGHPEMDFVHTPTVVVQNLGTGDGGRAVVFSVTLQLYNRELWGELSVEEGLTEAETMIYPFIINVSVPIDAKTGFYEGVLEIETSNGTLTDSLILPVSYVVVQQLDAPGEVLEIDGSSFQEVGPYQNFRIIGGEDWMGSWECGDFKFYPLEIVDQDAKDLVLSLSWMGKLTQVDVIVLDPSGGIASTSPIQYYADGLFLYSTTTGTSEQVLVVDVSDKPGVYTIVIHNTLSDGALVFPDVISLRALYTTETTLNLTWDASSNVDVPGSLTAQIVYGDLEATALVSSQAESILTVEGVNVYHMDQEDFDGTIGPYSSPFYTPWGTYNPSEAEFYYFESGIHVKALVDWSSEDVDIDLVPIDPLGNFIPAFEMSSTLNKPETCEFYTTIAGYYEFVVVLSSEGETDYTLSLSVPVLLAQSSVFEPDKVSLDTTTMADELNATFQVEVLSNSNYGAPSYRFTIDNHEPIIAIDGILKDSVKENITVTIVDTSVYQYTYNFTYYPYPNGPKILSDTNLLGENVTIDTTNLEEGFYSIHVNATDYFNRTSEVVGKVIVDKNEPLMEVTGVDEGDYLEGVVPIGINVTEAHLSGYPLGYVGLFVDWELWDEEFYSFRAGYNTYNLDTTLMEDGSHMLWFQTRDDAGRIAFKRINVHVDNTPPTLDVKGIEDGQYVLDILSIEVEASDIYLRWLNITIDDNKTISIASGIHDLDLEDGDHTIKIEATDELGHVTSLTYIVHVDRTTPTLSIEGVSEGGFVKEILSINIEPRLLYLENVTISLSGNPEELINAPYTYSIDTRQLKDGEYTLRVRTYYKTGKMIQEVLTLTIDNTYPILVIGGVEDGEYIAGDITLSIEALDAYLGNITLEIDGLRSDITANDTYSTQGLTDGVHVIAVTSFDLAGNSKKTTFTITMDNTEPKVSITHPSQGMVLSEVSNVTYSVYDENLDNVKLIIDESIYDVTGKTIFVWNTSKVGDGEHRITLVAEDKSGNNGSTTLTVTTNNVELAKTESYETGYEEGTTAGYQGGYVEGRSAGYLEGYLEGQEFGYDTGHQDGYAEGETTGHQAGYSEGNATGYESGKSEGYIEGKKTGLIDGLLYGAIGGLMIGTAIGILVYILPKRFRRQK